jgi:cobalamin biosynthesis protein CbiD
VECKDTLTYNVYQGIFVTKELAIKAAMHFLIEVSKNVEFRYDILEAIKLNKFEEALELSRKRPISIEIIELELKYSLPYPVING